MSYTRICRLALGAVLGAIALAGCATSPVGVVPLRAMPSRTPGGVLAVWYSGDVGWGRPDREVIVALARRGVPSVEVDSRTYFWRRRPADEAAKGLAKTIHEYGALWGAKRVVVVGYSFGGAAVPLILPHMAAGDLDQVKAVVLMAPSRKGQLVMRLWTLAEGMEPNAVPIGSALQAVSKPVLCVYGMQDHLAACPDLAGAEKVALPGGHTFKGQTTAVADAIVGFLQRQGIQ